MILLLFSITLIKNDSEICVLKSKYPIVSVIKKLLDMYKIILETI